MKEMEKFNITATDLTEDGREAVFVVEPSFRATVLLSETLFVEFFFLQFPVMRLPASELMVYCMRFLHAMV